MQLDTWKWFNGRTEDRILNWRNYRKTLQPDYVSQVAADWAQCPLEHRYLNIDDPTDWPDAWSLIGAGHYCDCARALGMFYTLYYSDYRHCDTMVLQCFKDRKNHQYLNLVNCEGGKYMLNYQLGAVVNISTIGPDVDLINTVTSLKRTRE